MSGRVTLSIRSLNLHGFSRSQANRVEDGFRNELARLTASDVSGAMASAHKSLTIPAGSNRPEDIGRRAAQQLIKGLDQ